MLFFFCLSSVPIVLPHCLAQPLDQRNSLKWFITVLLLKWYFPLFQWSPRAASISMKTDRVCLPLPWREVWQCCDRDNRTRIRIGNAENRCPAVIVFCWLKDGWIACQFSSGELLVCTSVHWGTSWLKGGKRELHRPKQKFCHKMLDLVDYVVLFCMLYLWKYIVTNKCTALIWEKPFKS